MNTRNHTLVIGTILFAGIVPLHAAIVNSPLVASSTTLGYWHPILLPGTATTS